MNWKAPALVASFSLVARADPLLPDPQVVTYPPGADKIVVVKKGDPVPYTGQLFEDNTALRWAMWLQQYKSRYGLDMKAAQDTCKVKLDHADTMAAIERGRADKVEVELKTRLESTEVQRLKLEEELRNPGFFKQPGFWYGVGVVSTLATAVVVSYSIRR
jgi:hypothetical protein